MSIKKSTYHWFVKYKIYHLPFWFAYHFVSATIKVGDPIVVANYVFSTTPSVKFIFYVIFQAIAVYFNLYFLIPRLLEKNKFVEYIFCVIVLILGTASIIVPGYFIGASLLGESVETMYGTDKFSYFFLTYSLPSTTASMTLAMSIKLTKNWIQAKRKHQLLEKEKLQTELKFLRSQFNPHFLFNTINSIFVLIHKDPTMASEALSKFSDLLRYQLYECSEHDIPLSQELLYVQNFIELEKLRHDHHRLQLTTDIEGGHFPTLFIAPFILIPFIENAFKHVSRDWHPYDWIKMDIKVNQHKLHFNIENSISSQSTVAREVVEYTGIGLNNVRRRLDLLYPQKHKLVVEKRDDVFKVLLVLELNERQVTKQKVNQRKKMAAKSLINVHPKY